MGNDEVTLVDYALRDLVEAICELTTEDEVESVK